MSEFIHYLIPILGSALLNFVWQGIIIGLCTWLILALLSNAKAQTRYAAACTGLLLCALMPIIHLFYAGTHLSTSNVTLIDAQSGYTSMALLNIAETLPPWSAWTDRLAGLQPWLVAAWASISALLLLRMLFGLRWVQRVRNASSLNLPEPLQQQVARMASQLRISQTVICRLTDHGISPIVSGVWRPVILLPAALLLKMPQASLEALLAHELAHIRRHDYLVNLLQNIIEAALFYHPVVWWLSRRICHERELIADELASTVISNRRQLAVALAELDQVARSQQTLLQEADLANASLVPAAHGGHLMSRIQQLIRPTRIPRHGKILLPLLSIAAATVAFYAFASVDSSAKQTRSTARNEISVSGNLDVNGRSKDGYAFVTANSDSIAMSGSTDDIDDIQAAQKKIDGDFLWFRRDGDAYAVRDPALVKQAKAEWARAEKYTAQMEALSNRMQVHSNKMEELSNKMEALSSQAGPSEKMQTALNRLSALAEQQRQLARKQGALASKLPADNDAELNRVEREMAELDRQMEALNTQMETQNAIIEAEDDAMQANEGPMDAVGKEMDEASKPMDAIGKEMDEVGQKIEAEMRIVDKNIRALTQQAINQGLAEPVSR